MATVNSFPVSETPPLDLSPHVAQAVEELPQDHVTRREIRRHSHDSLTIPDIAKLALISPRRSQRPRRLRWRDEAGSMLCSSIYFYKDDPPTACTNYSHHDPTALWCVSSQSEISTPQLNRFGDDVDISLSLRTRSKPRHGLLRGSTVDGRSDKQLPSPSPAQLSHTATYDGTNEMFCPCKTVVRFDDISCLPKFRSEMLHALSKKCVQLEDVTIRAPHIFFSILVFNLFFEKEVAVRYTLDKWRTHKDLQAEYLPGSSEPSTDRFWVSF